MKILILCTGNSCRSQMAEIFIKSFDSRIFVVSSGTNPSKEIHPKTIKVMDELGFELKGKEPKSVKNFIQENFDYVITVCSGADQSCPTFAGKVKNRLHIGFDDPAEAKGSEKEIMDEFRKIRDQIKEKFQNFYTNEILPKLDSE